MRDDSAQPDTTVRFVHYQPPRRWFLAVWIGLYTMICLGIIILGMMGQVKVDSAPTGSLNFYILLSFAVLLFAYFAWAFYRFVWVVETRDEGLYVQYVLGNTQIIPWREIGQIRVLWHRGGSALHIGGGSSILYEARININYYSSRKGREQVDDLMSVIALAAHLSLFRRSLLGSPIYKRE